VDLSRPLRPVAAPSLRPWAGTRLGLGVGEIWVAGPASVVPLADGSSPTLDSLAAQAREALVGSAGMAMLGPRFPLLAKLIDAADWLSLQVHPDDALARRLYGPDAVGKDEAWVVLEAEPATRLVVGADPGLSAEAVRAVVAAGTMGFSHCELRRPVRGEVLEVPAGTIHAIGPGAFVYELEQPSDLTFRISDWGRPQTPGRRLHLAEAREAVAARQHATVVGSAWSLDGGALNGRSFRVELVAAGHDSARTPAGRSPELVTACGGAVALRGDGWTETLAPLETAVVPAGVAAYGVAVAGDAVALVGSLPR
jgi:mannose-6-phosphate isomerase